ncbi:carboxypeptidase-like regulatory domain-containing protein [Saccharicrinis sp. FJH2]|uniref:TonB-dependent receptor n=1 Tax=Saccharicrinis sp. FJH65 TaxID=3344659 RepID=UPI0035F4D0F9
MNRYVLGICIFIFSVFNLKPDNLPVDKSYKVSGTILDAQTKDHLPGAAVFVENTARGTATDLDGKFELMLSEGEYVLMVTFVGYQKTTVTINVPLDKPVVILLKPVDKQLSEVNVSGKQPDENVRSVQMGIQKLDKNTIKSIPAFMGEVDIIKAIQLLPGVQATSEGSSGFSVRGGAPDQNLILLDNAPVYNASHLMGFFSVFNNDFVQDVTLYKGDIPANVGGRLSSFLDIKSINGTPGKISGQGGIGSISSRLMLQGSLSRTTTFALSGRRTYADLGLKLYDKERFKDTKLFFYDLNLKLNQTFSRRDRVFLSAYLGDDTFGQSTFAMRFGNQIMSLRWNHIFNDNLWSDLTLLGTQYRYILGNNDPEEATNSFEWVSGVKDFGVKYDLNWHIRENINLQTGFSTTMHQFSPGAFYAQSDSAFFQDFVIKGTQALEHGIYASVNPNIGNRLKLKLGLRISAFQSMGESIIYNYNDNYNPTDSVVHGQWDIYNTYWGIEPRIGFTYIINKSTSFKGSYNRNYQYMQIASNATSGSPFEIWFPASPNIKPQEVNQFALGYFKNFMDNSIELSLEGYYKKYKNTVDFRDHANLFLNQYLEGEVRVGEGQAYGMELLVRFNQKKWNGWIAYTLSRAERKIPEINDGRTYLAPYDKTHDVSVVFNYKLSDNFSVSSNWVYATGNAVTFPTGRFVYKGKILPVYSDRNSYRMPDYHRLDIGITYTPKPNSAKRWHSEWNLSVYNVYNRHNAWTINFYQEDYNPNLLYAEMTYLFPVLPAITYNFKF